MKAVSLPVRCSWNLFWCRIDDNAAKRGFYPFRRITVAHKKSDLSTGIILISHGIDDRAIKKQNKCRAFHDYSKRVLLADRLKHRCAGRVDKKLRPGRFIEV